MWLSDHLTGLDPHVVVQTRSRFESSILSTNPPFNTATPIALLVCIGEVMTSTMTLSIRVDSRRDG